MITLSGMCRYRTYEITKTVTITQLPEHHDEQLIPASEMLYVFIPFVFHYNSIKNSLRQEFYKLRENIFSGVHQMTNLLVNSKGSQFKSSPSFYRFNLLYLNNLQTSSLSFSGH